MFTYTWTQPGLKEDMNGNFWKSLKVEQNCTCCGGKLGSVPAPSALQAPGLSGPGSLLAGGGGEVLLLGWEPGLTAAREVQDSLKPALLLQTGGLSLSEPPDTNSRDSGGHPAIPLILPKVSAVNGVCLCLQGEPQVSTSVSPPSFFKSPKPG